MKFNIVEGESKNLDEIYLKFKELYLNPFTKVSDVKNTLQLSNAEYRTLRKTLKAEMGVETKPTIQNPTGKYNNPNKYIHKQDGAYLIKRNRKYYGRYKTLEEARTTRDFLIKNNWEKI